MTAGGAGATAFGLVGRRRSVPTFLIHPHDSRKTHIGEQELLDRDFARARQHFQQVRNSCPRTYLPYFIAKAELSRMTK